MPDDTMDRQTIWVQETRFHPRWTYAPLWVIHSFQSFGLAKLSKFSAYGTAELSEERKISYLYLASEQ